MQNEHFQNVAHQRIFLFNRETGNDGVLIHTFASCEEASVWLGISPEEVLDYVQTGRIYSADPNVPASQLQYEEEWHRLQLAKEQLALYEDYFPVPEEVEPGPAPDARLLSQSSEARQQRVRAAKCPVHDVAMASIEEITTATRGSYFLVQCTYSHCFITAIALSTQEPVSLLPEYSYLIP